MELTNEEKKYIDHVVGYVVSESDLPKTEEELTAFCKHLVERFKERFVNN